ncbi:ATP-binding cassette domain-containing protein [Cohnella sp. CFH 77786]|uniref:ABC transporter ATP-binding protein n=1 Tax=Cohnella sp. CFH 77786 TaxID=2662265 RepID=UPI001C60F134|nr:ABC transporter ATP-binding protein [Cohnella sp. CFH 77786]MBW5446561.1 ATP-binding cassette domain-containing protein [Cohnella sp. CFH 77786]
MSTNTPKAQETVLSVQGLKKSIGRKEIIKGVSFDVRAGEIFGFLGPNGSGKTTTIRMLVDLIKPTSGRILVCGEDVNRNPERALRHVGCIVENPEMYGYLTGWENLEHFARMQEGITAERIAEVVEIVGMDRRIHDKVKTYSLGMRQRLGIAQALLGKPKLLILDEPTNGLDPLGIKELRAFIRRLADGGMSLFISSHLLSEIQLMCDRVAIIARGEVIAVGDVDELVSQADTYTVWLLDRPEAGKAMLEADPGVRLIGEHEHRIDDSILAGMPEAIITVMEEDRIAGTVARFVGAGIGVKAVQRVSPSLEELFLGLTEGEKIG